MPVRNQIPHDAGTVVGEQVPADHIRILATPVDIAAHHSAVTTIPVRILEDREDVGQAVVAIVVVVDDTAFVTGPAVILPSCRGSQLYIHFLNSILPHIRNPKVARLPVKAGAPRV